MKIIKFKKILLTPSELQKRGVPSIKRIGIREDEIIIEFETDVTQGDIQKILSILKQDRWELIEE